MHDERTEGFVQGPVPLGACLPKTGNGLGTVALIGVHGFGAICHLVEPRSGLQDANPALQSIALYTL